MGWNGTSVGSRPVPIVSEDRTVKGTTAAERRVVNTSTIGTKRWRTNTVISGLLYIVMYGFLIPQYAGWAGIRWIGSPPGRDIIVRRGSRRTTWVIPELPSGYFLFRSTTARGRVIFRAEPNACVPEAGLVDRYGRWQVNDEPPELGVIAVTGSERICCADVRFLLVRHSAQSCQCSPQ